MVADPNERDLGRWSHDSIEPTSHPRCKCMDSSPLRSFSHLQVNTPFILAPPMAARSFYSSISGSRQLPPPYDQFHSYPCLRPPQIHLEFAGWNVEVLKGRRDKGTFAPGGRFSLGRLETGSGYCIGNVVESRMGVEVSMSGKDGETSFGGGNGLADVWIIGEPFFRDVQVAVDVRNPDVRRWLDTDKIAVEGKESWYAEGMKSTGFVEIYNTILGAVTS
jgi:hypothetical protein